LRLEWQPFWLCGPLFNYYVTFRRSLLPLKPKGESKKMAMIEPPGSLAALLYFCGSFARAGIIENSAQAAQLISQFVTVRRVITALVTALDMCGNHGQLFGYQQAFHNESASL
jgi:hypothetical protein